MGCVIRPSPRQKLCLSLGPSSSSFQSSSSALTVLAGRLDSSSIHHLFIHSSVKLGSGSSGGRAVAALCPPPFPPIPQALINGDLNQPSHPEASNPMERILKSARESGSLNLSNRSLRFLTVTPKSHLSHLVSIYSVLLQISPGSHPIQSDGPPPPLAPAKAA